MMLKIKPTTCGTKNKNTKQRTKTKKINKNVLN